MRIRLRLRGWLQILLPLGLVAALFGIWALVIRIFDIAPYVLRGARQVVPLTELLTNRTLPSAMAMLAPPEWLLVTFR